MQYSYWNCGAILGSTDLDSGSVQEVFLKCPTSQRFSTLFFDDWSSVMYNRYGVKHNVGIGRRNQR